MDISQQIAQYIITGLTIGAIYALVAIGFNIIHNATGIVNFAQCEFISLGGMFMYTLVVPLKVKLFIAFFISMAAVALIGALIERGPIRHARSKEIIILIFLTIGISEVHPGPNDKDLKTIGDSLVARADVALYAAKSAGRDRVIVEAA